AVAVVLILVGGVDAIQTFVILAATPFMIIMIGMAISFFMELRHDPLRQSVNPPVRKHAPDLADNDISQQTSSESNGGEGLSGPPAGERSQPPIPVTTRERPMIPPEDDRSSEAD